MSYIVYGTGRSRVTLYDTAGTPTVRITLQKETREGLTLKFSPEGQLHKKGSGAAWGQDWQHRGFRPSLQIEWTHGLMTLRETYTSGAWSAAVEIPTAEALGQILNSAFVAPCLVQPHVDHSFAFLAQPDPETAFELRDVKGVAHTGLTLSLMGRSLTAIPTWSLG